ncbi:pyrroline-5-carboxylate reductase-like isoform X3 [Ischnura elegans]|uniref:pyrroline-5-carboxylate reductase-like isoform X3 n=1 Tax=Ischnura elegans TaxID=197161 RepID=UPI001ED8B324|nr:pyrroline-5-carboxylate reductase-like isoform X3 [Ischnura elegans]
MALRIGFLGAGKMAQAIAKGIISTGMVKADSVIASSPPQDQLYLDFFKDLGCGITHRNEDVVSSSNVVIVAVKPNVMSNVLQSVKNATTSEKLFISVAMGIEIRDIREVLRPSDPKIARVMPNTCVSVGEGACAFVASDDPSADTVTKLFSAVGTCHRLTDESQLDAVTALSGAGPAYEIP